MKLRFGMILLIFALLGTLGISVAGAQAPAECVNVINVWDGDTLYGIARRENVVVAELAAVNNIPITTRLRIGDRLCIDGLAIAQQPALIGGGDPGQGGANSPGTNQGTGSDNVGQGGASATSPMIPVNPGGFNFIRGQTPRGLGDLTVNVALGDTLYSISRVFQGTNVQQFVTLNNISNIHQIFAGETLLVPISDTNTGGNNNIGGNSNNIGGNTNVVVHVPPVGTIPTIGIPRQAMAGDSIGVTGANYPGNTQVDIFFEHKLLGLSTALVTTVTTNPDGTFSQLITVPNTFSNGAAINQLPAVSVVGYAKPSGEYWAMNFFVVQ